jgi:hypothetical protein
MEENPEEDPFRVPADAAEFKQFKRRLNASTMQDVVQKEPTYTREYNKYGVHRMDSRTANTVVDSFYFTTKEAAQAAINYANTFQK